jgi:hypothetical protein
MTSTFIGSKKAEYVILKPEDDPEYKQPTQIDVSFWDTVYSTCCRWSLAQRLTLIGSEISPAAGLKSGQFDR